MARTKRKPARIKTRNWIAVQAKFRNSAGNMGDKRKQNSKDACRKWKQQKEN